MPDLNSPYEAGAEFFGALSLATAGALSLLLYEAWALKTGHQPITSKTRHAYHEFPAWASALIFAGGFLGGHLLWCGCRDSKVDKLIRKLGVPVVKALPGGKQWSLATRS